MTHPSPGDNIHLQSRIACPSYVHVVPFLSYVAHPRLCAVVPSAKPGGSGLFHPAFRSASLACLAGVAHVPHTVAAFIPNRSW